MKTKYTNYDECLFNLSSSVLKHFGVKWDKPGLKEVDEALKNKKKVAIILLDGMGMNILDKNLPKDSFLRKNVNRSISSVFPPTTVAATTSVLTALSPIEHGWLGWHLYLTNTDPSIILFVGKDYYKGTDFKAYSAWDKLPNKTILDYVSEKGINTYSIWPSFKEGGFKDFDSGVTRLEEILKDDNPSLTYFYWDYPDALIHELGTDNDALKGLLNNYNERLEKFNETIDEDTVVFIIADHGLIDVKPIDFSKFKDLNKMLKKKMSGEGRASIFHVKKKELNNFKYLFNYYFDEWFDLYTKEEILSNNIYGYGNINPMTKYTLGDYVAIAKDIYYLTHDISFEFKGHHAGGLKDESEIPLIILGGKK